MTDAYDPAADSFGSYQLAIAAMRERGVRLGLFEPINEDETRRAAEGLKPYAELDCVRGAS